MCNKNSYICNCLGSVPAYEYARDWLMRYILEEEKNNRKHNFKMGDEKHIYPGTQNIAYKIMLVLKK